MNYLPILVWIVRLTFPVVVFWYLWRNKNGPFGPQRSWAGKKRIYQRCYMLCFKPMESSNDPTVKAQLMRLETMEELSKTMPSIRKALTKAKRKSETQPKNPSSLMVESLVNYLAYNAPEKRQFLPETPTIAPVAARAQRASSSFSDGRPHNSISSEADVQSVVARNNDEAVRILQGALIFKKVSVADRLYKQLTEAEITISEMAYSLMVQVAVAAKDLDAATDYLLKMESAGVNPPLALVQSAMTLHSEAKKTDAKENVDFGVGPKCMDKSSEKLPLVDGTNITMDKSSDKLPLVDDGYGVCTGSRLSPDAQEFIPGYSYGESFMRSRGVRCGVLGHYGDG